jgi:hypothetical protein
MKRVCPMNRLGNFSCFLWGQAGRSDKVEHDLKSPANGDSVTLAGIPQRPVALWADFHRTVKHLRDVQTSPARSPLPDVIVNLVSQRLGLCGRVLRPVVHPRPQYQELSSRLFGCFLYPCANVLISVIINPIIC